MKTAKYFIYILIALFWFNPVFGQESGVARFTVTKDFSDKNPSGVMVYISCDTGLPLTSDSEIWDAPGSHVTFIVDAFVPGTMECTITEAPIPGGYTGTYVAGLGDDGIADSIAGGDTACVFNGVVGGHFTCEIANHANPGSFTVHKDWNVFNEEEGGSEVIEQVDITIWCNAEINGGSHDYDSDDWYLSDSLGDGEKLTATVNTTEGPATCWADEKIYQSGVESTDDCDARLIFAGGSGQCRFVNTVFFEGIPTLNQYGLALLALLMLSVGFVGFRRFA